MKTQLQCLPCFIRQASEALTIATDDPVVQEQVLRRVLSEVSQMDLGDNPPLMGQQIHRLVRRLSGHPDPYRTIKKQCNDVAEKLLPHLYRQLAATDRPLEMALRLAMAGNIIDFGVNPGFSLDSIESVIEETLRFPLDPKLLDRFEQDLKRAQCILYLADNTGEIFFDRLLIEQLPMDKVTLAVRGGPILNDALREDAERAGLNTRVRVIDNGSDAPGTVLEDCCEEFRDAFRQAHLIIAKGQGNYETLHDAPQNIFFLLKAKCPVTAEMAGVPLGHTIFSRSEPNTYAEWPDRF
jgi:uncharacterized protein with ATP-grasp and redox domains